MTIEIPTNLTTIFYSLAGLVGVSYTLRAAFSFINIREHVKSSRNNTQQVHVGGNGSGYQVAMQSEISGLNKAMATQTEILRQQDLTNKSILKTQADLVACMRDLKQMLRRRTG